MRIKRAKEIWAVVVEKVHKETFSWEVGPGPGPGIRNLGFPALRVNLRRQSIKYLQQVQQSSATCILRRQSNTCSKSTKAVQDN